MQGAREANEPELRAAQEGLSQEFVTPYTPEQNGMIEGSITP
jgi:hypothetical protein